MENFIETNKTYSNRILAQGYQDIENPNEEPISVGIAVLALFGKTIQII